MSIVNVPNGKTSNEEAVEYFTSCEWGKIYEEDKYWDEEDLYDNFIIFYVYVYAYLNLPRPSRAQLEMALFVADRKNPHRMIMAMRGLSKSLTSQAYVIWRLMNDPNEKILVMSAGATRAANYTQFILRLLKALPVCNGMAPRFNKERTSSQSFDIAGAEPSDSPSLYAVGVGNQITGFRATICVLDDVETPQNSGSVVQRDKVNHYTSEASNILMTGRDEIVVLCTQHSVDSIYTDWINSKGFKPFIIPAEYPADLSVYGNGLAPYIRERIANNPELVGQTVDERFTADVLASKRLRIGKSQYKLQYMLDVSMSDDMKHPLKLSDFIVMDVDNDDAPIKVSHSAMRENQILTKHNGFKSDRLFAPSFVSDQRTEYNYRVMSIDPSGRGADETGLCIAYSVAGRIFVKKITGIEGGYEHETLTMIAQMCSDYKIDYLVIESNFGDGAFAKSLEPILGRISPRTMIEEVRAKGQKEVRIITTLEPLMNQHKIILDRKILDDDLTATSVNNSFTFQLSHIAKTPNCLRHDDRLDAFEMLCRFMVERENFDEEYEAEKLDKDKLEEDLLQFMADFKIKLGRNRNNYGARY